MTTANKTRHREAAEKDVRTEIGLLGKLIEDKFPAEAACADLSSHKDVVRITKELLDRLWRWEQ